MTLVDTLERFDCKANETRMDCGLVLDSNMAINPMQKNLVEHMHNKHHEDKHELSADAYNIIISDKTGRGECTNFCIGSNNEQSMEYIYETIEREALQSNIICPLVDTGFNRRMNCGLLLRSTNINQSLEALVLAHVRHHKENHTITMRSLLSTPSYYTISPDGSCSCQVRNKPINIDDVLASTIIKCSVKFKTSTLQQFECGMIFPLFMELEQIKRLVRIHQYHHDCEHPKREYILPANKGVMCVCLTDDVFFEATINKTKKITRSVWI